MGKPPEEVLSPFILQTTNPEPSTLNQRKTLNPTASSPDHKPCYRDAENTLISLYNTLVSPRQHADFLSTHALVSRQVLPSLRPKFLADKIAQIQRKAHLTALQPNPIAKILSPRALSRLQTRQKGLKVLQMFQSKVDMLRKDDHQRASLQAKADEVRAEQPRQ
eukprot:2988965-Rhodomonas_salina.1